MSLERPLWRLKCGGCSSVLAAESQRWLRLDAISADWVANPERPNEMSAWCCCLDCWQWQNPGLGEPVAAALAHEEGPVERARRRG